MDIVSEYLDSLKHLSDKTKHIKEYALKLYQDYVNDDYIKSINAIEFSSYLKDKGLSNTTIKTALREIQLFFDWLLEEKNMHYKIEHKKDVMRTLRVYQKKEVFTDEEIKILFDYIKQNAHPIYYVFTLLLLHSGLRLNSLLELNADDLIVKKYKVMTDEFESSEKELLILDVKHSKFDKPYQAGMPLLLDIERFIIKKFFSQKKGKELWSYTIKYPKSVKQKTLTEDAVHQFYHRASKKLNIKIYPHKFRYTYASRLISESFSVALVQEWLGHASPGTTLKVYTKSMLDKEIEKWIK